MEVASLKPFNLAGKKGPWITVPVVYLLDGYDHYVKQTLGEEFYTNAQQIEPVRLALEVAGRNKVNLKTNDSMYSLAYPETKTISIGIQLPMWKQLSSLVHEMVHLRQGSRQLVNFIEGGATKYLKAELENEYEAYAEEAKVWELIPERLKDTLFEYSKGLMGNQGIKRYILKNIFINGISYPRYYYKGLTTTLNTHGMKLDASSKVIPSPAYDFFKLRVEAISGIK